MWAAVVGDEFPCMCEAGNRVGSKCGYRSVQVAMEAKSAVPLATPHTLDLELGMETELMKVRWLMAPLTSTPAQKYKPLFGDGYPGDDYMLNMKEKVDNFHTAWVILPWFAQGMTWIWFGNGLHMVTNSMYSGRPEVGRW